MPAPIAFAIEEITALPPIQKSFMVSEEIERVLTKFIEKWVSIVPLFQKHIIGQVEVWRGISYITFRGSLICLYFCPWGQDLSWVLTWHNFILSLKATQSQYAFYFRETWNMWYITILQQWKYTINCYVYYIYCSYYMCPDMCWMHFNNMKKYNK